MNFFIKMNKINGLIIIIVFFILIGMLIWLSIIMYKRFNNNEWLSIKINKNEFGQKQSKFMQTLKSCLFLIPILIASTLLIINIAIIGGYFI